MLTIKIPENEIYDERTNKLKTIPSCIVNLEHSLISLAKWESKWNKSFLSTFSKVGFTAEMFRDYILCMTISSISSEELLGLTNENIDEIRRYIDNPMTATVFSNRGSEPVSHRTITAEILYYRMFTNQIPIDCQKWHLNRLLTLLKVFDRETASQKKMSKRDTAARNAQLNAKRRAQMNTRG